MTNKFDRFKQLYQENKLDLLLKEEGSHYWLKLRSAARKDLLLELSALAKVDCSNIKGTALFEHIFSSNLSETLLDEFIEKKYAEERSLRKENETRLVSELYKMSVFNWGGLYQNNLEKTIIDNYVKKIQDFELLNKKIENEIHESLRGYVQCSWYNHWTSILIEDLFKDNEKVTPTVGLIKKVDFFIDSIPFDLKVTYFPEGYMLTRRKEAGLPTELQALKRFSKELGIKYNREQKDKQLFSELLLRISESVDPKAKQFIQDFKETRWKIIDDVIKNPKNLIKWLYEEQGERRFDASNRLFLVLIDKENLEESWKMKRNIDLLKDKINGHLNSFDSENRSKLETTFKWLDGKTYSTLSDVLFIIKG